MAVYTHLGAEDLAKLIAAYDVGDLVSAKGIAEGVSNSNWLVETTGADGSGARFILTMYEYRIDVEQLPFYLGLLDHLSARDCPVPRTIHDREGAACRMIGDKAVALIEFLPGISIDRPTPDQALAVGGALAQLHGAVGDFDRTLAQSMGLPEWRRLIEACGAGRLAAIDPALPDLAMAELDFLEANWPDALPREVVHCDLFPDNVLMLGDKVSGLIDFYFAAEDFLAYDFAVTHAAWCFGDRGTAFRPAISQALMAGYESRRVLSPAERAALPVLVRGACMRFLASRAYDWVHTPADALVVRKDPMDFAARLDFYREHATALFA